MATTYLGTVAREQLDQAQAVVDQHIVSCVACGTNRPCYDRIEAERVFLRYDRLPRRTPGLTTPQDASGFTWLR
jgi:hypothetical protein